MEEFVDEPLEIILYRNDGRLGKGYYFLSFNGLEEIVEYLSFVLSDKLDYSPIIRINHGPYEISIRDNENQEYFFRVRETHSIYRRKVDPYDGLVVSVEEIQGLPIFVKKVDKENIYLLFYLDKEPIINLLESRKYPIFGFINNPISRIRFGYFLKSDIREFDIGDIKVIYSYPIILKIESLDKFLEIIEKIIVKNLERPSYII